MISYLKLFVFLLVLSACSHRERSEGNSLFSFLDEEKPIPHLSLPEYKTWLEDTTHHHFVSFESDSFKVSLIYRPAAFEAGLAMQNSSEKFAALFNEKNKYHLFVVECFDKRTKTALKLKGGLEFMNHLSEGMYVVQDEKDTIAPIREVFTAPILNAPHQMYVLVQKDTQVKKYQACLYHPMLGHNRGLSLTIDSSSLANLPKIKL